MMTQTEKAGTIVFAVLWMAMAFCAALLSGCDSQDNQMQSQVAARVNDSEITIHQVNDRLKQGGFTNETAAKEAMIKVLDGLIDQELFVQQAKRKKLDRDPLVMQSIEDAKRQILTQAYLERLVYNRTPPTPDEIKAFYVGHPELFAKRRAYKFHVFSLAKNKFNDSLKHALESAKTVGDVASILKSKYIEFKANEVQWLAEQAPMEILPAIAKMKVGDIVSLEQGEQATVLLLEGAVDDPVDETQAQPVIQKYILNSKNKELLDNKLKQLRTGEQITYVGQFAELQSGTVAQAPEAKEPQASPPRDFIQKGLQGLK